jgi:hypothetical protein
MTTHPTKHHNRGLAADRLGLKAPARCGLFCCTAAAILVLMSFHHSLVQGQDDWAAAMHAINPAIETSFEIDEERVLAAGIRKLSGKHLDLYTDVREPAIVDELIPVFDLAVEQWRDYFSVKSKQTERWRLRAFLIADPNDPARFKQAGLIPADLPEFRAGFQRRHNLWFYLQPGDYYTRHLLIHEGTHGFMLWFLSGYGAPWYGEGMAEQFGVHSWHDQKLELQYRLRDRSQAPYWGRVKRIKDEHADGKGMTLSDVLDIPPTAFMEVRYYAWSWAGCEFFSKHESTRDEFAKLKKNAALDTRQFNRQFSLATADDWDLLARDWELFVGEMEYGYEVERGRISTAQSVDEHFGGVASKFKIDAGRSWQITELKVKQGDRIRVSGQGEFIVGQSIDSSNQQPGLRWKCQSNGITIEYYRGHPLGMLHVGFLNPDAASPREQIKGLLNPVPIGLKAEITAPHDGILCLRINESPAKLDDNQGALEVTVEKLK